MALMCAGSDTTMRRFIPDDTANASSAILPAMCSGSHPATVLSIALCHIQTVSSTFPGSADKTLLYLWIILPSHSGFMSSDMFPDPCCVISFFLCWVLYSEVISSVNLCGAARLFTGLNMWRTQRCGLGLGRHMN